jgi:hypothetical protein
VATSCLDILAGPDALAELRDGGLDPARVRVLIGASGGPKWLVLHGLDRVLFPWLLGGAQKAIQAGARQPIHAVASSIGSWRFASLCTAAPVEALSRFAEAYLEQRYPPSPTPREVTREGERILDALLGEAGSAPLVEHALVRLHIVTARFRHLGAHEGPGQLLGLAFAALANAVHRRALGVCVERVVFDSLGDPGPFAPWPTLPTRHVALTIHNVRQALTASAAIPRVMAGVRSPTGAPPGVYRDGGVTDYHFDASVEPPDGIALYPHFYSHLIPGWFDKPLGWRRARGLRRLVLIAPSAEYVRSLPHGRIPDRTDFVRMGDAERISAWRQVLALGARLGETFGELVSTGRIGRVARALS